MFTTFNSFKHYKLSAPDKTEFVGFENYIEIFKEKVFVEALIRTIGLTAVVVTIELGLGLIIAIFLSRGFKGHGIIRSLLVLPLAVTPIVNGLNMRLLFDARVGIVKHLFNVLHITSPDAMLANPAWALGIIVITDVWKYTPFMIIILLAGILGHPKELYEAALVDGANMFQVYTKISIPLLKRVMGVALLIRLTDAFRIFDQVYALTEGGPGTSTETLTIHIYREGFRYLNIGTASTMSLVMSIFLMIFVLFMIKKINLLGE
jgi:multiple sugar transport system permease protein